MKKSTKYILIIILVVIVGGGILIWQNFLAHVEQNFLALAISSPCGYENYAWGAVKGTCDCTGIIVDTSCKIDGQPCPDAGSSYGCIGIAKNHKCFRGNRTFGNIEWTEIPCSK